MGSKRPTTANAKKKARGLRLLREGVPIGEVAELLGVSRSTIWRWRKSAPPPDPSPIEQPKPPPKAPPTSGVREGLQHLVETGVLEPDSVTFDEDGDETDAEIEVKANAPWDRDQPRGTTVIVDGQWIDVRGGFGDLVDERDFPGQKFPVPASGKPGSPVSVPVRDPKRRRIPALDWADMHGVNMGWR